MNPTLEFPGVSKQQYMTGGGTVGSGEMLTPYYQNTVPIMIKKVSQLLTFQVNKYTCPTLLKKKARYYWRIVFRADPVVSYEDWIQTQPQDLQINSICLPALARDSTTLCSVAWPTLPTLLTAEILFAIYFQFWCSLGILLQAPLPTIQLQFPLPVLLDVSPKHYVHGKRDYVSFVTATLRPSKLPLVTCIGCLPASRHQYLRSCRRKDPGP